MAPVIVFLILLALFPSGWAQCPERNGYFADNKQCDRYYECVDGQATEKLCPDGLMFNDRGDPRKLRCDFPHDVDCRSRPQVQPAQPVGPCFHRWGLYPNVQDCGRFWNCVDGYAHEFRCPEGLAYNDLTARCDWADEVDSCDSEAILDFTCPQPTELELLNFGLLRYPHPNDCKKFYICLETENGKFKPRMLSCDAPHVFNYAINRCDWTANVTGCENYYSNPVPQLNLRPVARSGDSSPLLDFRRKDVKRTGR